MNPGLHSVTNAEYHKGPGLSSSDLKQLIKSPLHYTEYKRNPEEPTPQMVLGSLVHAMVLEPETVPRDYHVGIHKIRRGKEYEATVAENPGKVILTAEQYQRAEAIVAGLIQAQRESPDLAALFAGVREQAHYWEDPETGILCKCKPDAIGTNGIITELKTATAADFDSFQSEVVRLMYFLSAAFYVRGTRLTPGAYEAKRVIFVVVETDAPYAVAVYELDAKALEMGDYLVSQALNSYAEAVSTDDWRGYSKEIVSMGLPNYAFYKLNLVGTK